MKVLSTAIHMNSIYAKNVNFGSKNSVQNPIEIFLEKQEINGQKRFSKGEIKSITDEIEKTRAKHHMGKYDNEEFVDALCYLLTCKKPVNNFKDEVLLSGEDIASLISIDEYDDRYHFNKWALSYFNMRSGINGKDIKRIREAVKGQSPDSISFMLMANDEKGKPVYSVDDICELLKYSNVDSGDHGLYGIVSTKVYDHIINDERYMTKNEVEQILRENVDKFRIQTSAAGVSVLRGNEDLTYYHVVNDGLEAYSKDTMKFSGDRYNTRRIFPDGRKIYSFGDAEEHQLQKHRLYAFDKDGRKLYSERINPSYMRPEFLTLERNDGHDIKKSAYLQKSGQNGEYRYEKEFVTPSGNMTKQTIEKNGNFNKSVYTVKDKDGNVLFNQVREFDKLSENHTQSKLNDKTYDMTFDSDKIFIKKFDKEGAEESMILDEKLIDKNLMPLFKKIPGDMLMIIGKNGISVNGVGSAVECMYLSDQNKINTVDDEVIFIHELGHAVDHKFLSEDDEGNKIRGDIEKRYRKNYYNVYINTDNLTATAIRKFRQFSEFLAETYQILSGTNISEKYAKELGIRTLSLQNHLSDAILFTAQKYNELGII
ncbi:hypothetical protein IJI31_01750 [bacterium]|nr:hypothetical protein [bacterium]